MDSYIWSVSTRQLAETSSKTHVLQYRIEPSRILSRPASSNAFSSAWMHKHVERSTPAFFPLLHRAPRDVRTAHSFFRPRVILTASFVAILEIPRSSIIAGTDDAFLLD
jgi:hypothetical protein